ncbi:MAG: translesion error-prone DNA polymerase V autoproteolytic subunit [Rubrivivax sp.]|nr:translesion error-prone DNA polymerase V autoproteolytic subunit [Pyrinomonadaceae bacterium]
MEVVGIYLPGRGMKLSRPLVACSVPAGFPSPAQDEIAGRIDLNRDLIKHPLATFYVRVEGDSMEPQIHSGELLVVDRMVETRDGDVIVARVGHEFMVKRLHTEEDGSIWLVSENTSYAPILVTEGMDFEVWGRVMYSINRH